MYCRLEETAVLMRNPMPASPARGAWHSAGSPPLRSSCRSSFRRSAHVRGKESRNHAIQFGWSDGLREKTIHASILASLLCRIQCIRGERHNGNGPVGVAICTYASRRIDPVESGHMKIRKQQIKLLTAQSGKRRLSRFHHPNGVTAPLKQFSREQRVDVIVLRE